MPGLLWLVNLAALISSSSSSLRASRFRPQWATLTQAPGGAVLRGRIPRPTTAEETDHSKGIYVLLLCSPLNALKSIVDMAKYVSINTY